MAARADLSSGQSLLIINNPVVAWPATLISLQKVSGALADSSGVRSSDSFAGQLVVSALGGPFKNSLIFDLAGNLTALINADSNITPAFTYSSYWQGLINPNASVGRPSLGVNYLDLSVSSPVGLNFSTGALLYPTATQPAVLKNSPAQVAGLVAGDIITWVNNQEVNASNDLADLIANYQPGDKITLTYHRAGADYLVDVKLGEAK
jgi:membrane-associated protease RseP (regulator of RpoE activity)